MWEGRGRMDWASFVRPCLLLPNFTDWQFKEDVLMPYTQHNTRGRPRCSLNQFICGTKLVLTQFCPSDHNHTFVDSTSAVITIQNCKVWKNLNYPSILIRVFLVAPLFDGVCLLFCIVFPCFPMNKQYQRPNTPTQHTRRAQMLSESVCLWYWYSIICRFTEIYIPEKIIQFLWKMIKAQHIWNAGLYKCPNPFLSQIRGVWK